MPRFLPQGPPVALSFSRQQREKPKWLAERCSGRRLVAEGGESLGRLGLGASVLLGVRQLSRGDLLALVVGSGLGLSAVLQTVDLVSELLHMLNSAAWTGHTETRRPGTSSRSRG
jgi:hypothetical protein